jgi:hypothetical protein
MRNSPAKTIYLSWSKYGRVASFKNRIGVAISAAPIPKAQAICAPSGCAARIVIKPSGRNSTTAVSRPGENLPRVHTKGAMWKNTALMSIRAGKPSARVGHCGATIAATMPSTTTSAFVT